MTKISYNPLTGKLHYVQAPFANAGKLGLCVDTTPPPTVCLDLCINNQFPGSWTIENLTNFQDPTTGAVCADPCAINLPLNEFYVLESSFCEASYTIDFCNQLGTSFWNVEMRRVPNIPTQPVELRVTLRLNGDFLNIDDTWQTDINLGLAPVDCFVSRSNLELPFIGAIGSARTCWPEGLGGGSVFINLNPGGTPASAGGPSPSALDLSTLGCGGCG